MRRELKALRTFWDFTSEEFFESKNQTWKNSFYFSWSLKSNFWTWDLFFFSWKAFKKFTKTSNCNNLNIFSKIINKCYLSSWAFYNHLILKKKSSKSLQTHFFHYQYEGHIFSARQITSVRQGCLTMVNMIWLIFLWQIISSLSIVFSSELWWMGGKRILSEKNMKLIYCSCDVRTHSEFYISCAYLVTEKVIWCHFLPRENFFIVFN